MLPKKHRCEDSSGPYPDVSKNVDFKHPFNLVVLSREQVGSCNHTGIIHQDGDIPNVLLHLLDRKNQKGACHLLSKNRKAVEDEQQLI